MKKLFILLLLSQFCLAQKYSSILVKYEAVLGSIKIDPVNVTHNDLFEDINESASKKRFVLKTNSNGFIFEEELIMEDDDGKNRMAKIASILFSINNFSYQKERNILFKVSNNMNVITNHLYEWELTSETKKIDNYTCYKATYIYHFVTTKGKEVNRLITAWYTPEISFSYGPNGYMGLPGLILELEHDKTKLVAKEVQFFKEDIKIDFPKYKEVTEEEFLKKISIK